MSELSAAAKEAYAALLVSHAVATRAIDRRLRDAGVVGIEVYDVLLALEDAEGRRLRMSELADHLVISRSGLTRLVDRLEGEGLLCRASCPGDRRGFHAVLTDKGLAERERAWPVYRQAIADVFGAHMSAEEASVVCTALRRVADQDPLRGHRGRTSCSSSPAA